MLNNIKLEKPGEKPMLYIDNLSEGRHHVLDIDMTSLVTKSRQWVWPAKAKAMRLLSKYTSVPVPKVYSLY